MPTRATLFNLASPTSFTATAGQRRRRSSAAKHPPNLNLTFQETADARNRLGTTSGLSGGSLGEGLPTIPGTPGIQSDHMSSRSPSPRPGGWSSPGLNTPYDSGGRASPFANGGAHNVTWASAQARSAEVKSYTAFNPRSQGFFGRHFRKISTSLPTSYAEKEKLGRGRFQGNKVAQVLTRIGRNLWRMKRSVGAVLLFVLCIIIFYVTPLHRVYRHSSLFGGGNKFVIILAANQGGGVMEWKGPREWAIERDSVKNKKKYTQRWGYELEIVDMSTKKRYAHEWRESWEKVDTIRNAMRKYPRAEWFWWLDTNTFVMEPSYSLQSHIFNQLNEVTYRDINHYNPLNISHPLTDEYLDLETRSAIGDGRSDSINLIVPQDCGGFNLGSFFVRRSLWTDRLLDMWWDPVGYEQKHMEWEHKEQDALEYMYTNQPWIRPHVAFIHQRKVNSFPPGACGDKGDDPKIHYQERDRDFLVNMAGCEWGRDCWAEMYNYRQLSNRLNRNPWEKFKDWISDSFKAVTAKKKDEKVKEKKGSH
ncbi:galactosyl transferase GMA12/MNN10 family-domain-containing protein [Dendryphion nanum]|uniref:Galactosyl transferase GMA12/MNN10 family-domain-containing protein n=1 Tax=Dendryphion nanum TaxID=256645 RepID=A0A9P9DS77_9PLEO|nr:galactosyl transferase GMA12/MNN10 family-domain-containing protein [Dendryphion nanum]